MPYRPLDAVPEPEVPPELTPEVIPETVPAADSAALMLAIATDEFAGQGGSYLFDPVTGKRTPIKDAVTI